MTARTNLAYDNKKSVARTAIGLVPTTVADYNHLIFSTLENNYSASCLTLFVAHVSIPVQYNNPKGHK